jgi:2-isopropylmalate synthase
MLNDPQVKCRAFTPIGLTDRCWPEVVLKRPPIWFGVDLRDGHQALIEPMDRQRKLRLFEMPLRIELKELEVGFPAASQTVFDFVGPLIDDRLVPDDLVVQGLTPAREPLIQRTFEALVGARRAMVVHVHDPTAPVMRQLVLGQSEDETVALALQHAQLVLHVAQSRPETEFTFQYSPEMFSGTELELSRQAVDGVTEAWKPSPHRPCIVNPASTVEHGKPNIFAHVIEWMHRHLARCDGFVLSVHPRNDRGTGTAAGDCALMAGPDRIEGCLFRSGERTGSVDLVSIALNLYAQGVPPGLEISDIAEVRRCVDHCNQFPVHPRHPCAGDLVYTSLSDSHQDATKKDFATQKDRQVWNMPYLPSDPKDLGRCCDALIRVNRQSGKGGIAYLLETGFGIELQRRLQIEFSQVVRVVMDASGKELTADQIWPVFEREYALVGPDAVVGSRAVIGPSESGGVQMFAEAEVRWRCVEFEGAGAGPIDAIREWAEPAAWSRHPSAGLPRTCDRSRRRCTGRGLHRALHRRVGDLVRRRARQQHRFGVAQGHCLRLATRTTPCGGRHSQFSRLSDRPPT